MSIRNTSRVLFAIALLHAGAAMALQASDSGFSYSGGDGSTLRKAVVVGGARTIEQGDAAELEWMRRHLPGAVVESRGRITGPPHYDVLTVKLADGVRIDLHFNITDLQVP